MTIDLDAIQALADAATLGPWIVDHQPNHHPDDPEWSIESAAMEFDDPIGIVDTDGLSQGQGDAEFIAASRALVPALIDRVRELTPRILSGDDWQAVRDQLDALPEGTQIRWRTGVDEHPALAIKRRVFHELRWATTDHDRHPDSTNIARDNTPIEVIA